MNWYARQLTNHPLLIVLGVLVVTLILTIVAILTQGLPTLKDPLLGFEPRGTELSQRSTAWHHLLEDSGRKGSLSMHPSIRDEPTPTDLTNKIENDSSRSSMFPSHSSDAWIVLEGEKDELHDFLDSPIVMREERKDTIRRKKWQSGANSNFFCDDPGREKVRVVFKSSAKNSDLFTLRSLRSICQIDKSKLRRGSHFTDLCTHDPDHNCCRSWSLPSYVALLANRSYCDDITEEDVSYAKQLLKSCAVFYHDLKLSHDCTSDPVLCREVPHECTRYNAVYNILHYLADSKFLGADTHSSKLTYTTVFLPVHQGLDSLDYFYDLQQLHLSDGVTEVFGMEFGLKHALLKYGLVHDITFTVLALVIVFCCLWMFTTSFLLTLMTTVAALSSLATSYFVYSAIYRISYFPLMNALAAVVLIGISSTDAFIYSKVWWTVKAEKTNGITSRQVRDTMQLSFPSMLANTVTVAAALYSNVCSSVTVVRCFSIFTGTAVLINFLLNLAWLPASIIITDRWCTRACCLCIPPFGIYLPYFQRFKCCSYTCSLLWRFHYLFTDASRVFFEKILPCLIIKPRWFWLTLLSATAIGSTVVIFYQPTLMPTASKEMQIFGSDHPFEKYDLLLKKYFWYEKASGHQTYHNLPIRVVWGVLPVDNGRYVDPSDRGKLVLDPEFHISARSSQKWLLMFCKELQNQTFYKVNPNRHESSCFIETFKYWMERRCVDGFTHQNRTPCCEISKFPYSQDVFNICIREAIAIFHRSQSYFVAPGVAGPRFSKETGDVRVVVVEYGSTVSSTGSYEEIKEFANAMNSWMASMLKSAPPGMKNGWFASDLDFYDLQAYLSCGTMATVGVALGAISLSLLVTTMNLIVAFCLVLTVTSIILVSLASLVLLGWKLHAVETLLVTMVTAMAADLSIRYGIAYHNSPHDDREGCLVFSVARLSSSIAMASITNFFAGLALMPTVIMTFLQIGIFLMILNTTSWIYSTFFLHSLLSLLSPGRNCFNSVSQPQSDKLYTLSESTLSTSSVSCPSQMQISNDHHQLEPLSVSRVASKQRPISRRSRSGSLSLFKCENPGWYGHPKRPSRKVSLPVVHISNPIEPSPKHVSGATSATTLVGGDDDRDGATFCRKEADSWPPIEILV